MTVDAGLGSEDKAEESFGPLLLAMITSEVAALASSYAFLLCLLSNIASILTEKQI